jgi:branched-chain amino acid transport system permease protein
MLLRLFDWSFAPQIQVYYLIAAWCLLCAALMYALTRTPFGRMCNAVRDNPERVQFVGYNPQVVRFTAFCLSGLFAGIAGGLVAINFEIANAALFGAAQSGSVLLATYIGGVGHFFGPILGAVLVTYLQTMLSDVTEFWQLYFGLMFVAAVMYAPGGLAGLLMLHAPLWRAGTLVRLVPSYLMMLVPLLLIGGAGVLIVEMAAHLAVKASEGTTVRFAGLVFDARSWLPWLAAVAALGAGVLAGRFALARTAAAWERGLAVAREKGVAL